ncbi:MAG: FmdB family zinc ribbon protein [Desulfovibrio sp.]
MPIYEYGCGKCNFIFEEWQTGFEERTMPCPKCGTEASRVMSQTSFHLKGEGWYVTEYGNKASGASEGSDSGSAGSTDASASDSGSTGAEASSAPSVGDSTSSAPAVS